MHSGFEVNIVAAARSVAGSSGRTSKQLSYTCFPVKLFRIVTDDAYGSLWWDSCGTHFIVDVPRFEIEFLRNEAIPEEDGFKTITFTSFIRQLNLYGFRKVTLHSDVFVDPRDWQRYAHPFFLRGRMDVLDRIKRQAPSRLGCSGANRNTSNVLHAIKGYNKAIKENFFYKGIQLSRTGPKPKYCNHNCIIPIKHRKYKKKIQAVITRTVNSDHACNIVPFNIDESQVLRAHAAPVPYYPPAGVNLQPILPQGYVWQNVQDNPDIPTFAFRQPSKNVAQLSTVAFDPSSVPVMHSEWQNAPLQVTQESGGERNASGSNQFHHNDFSLVSLQASHSLGEEGKRDPEIKKDKNLNEAQLNTMQFGFNQLDPTLTADVTVTSNASHCCPIDEIEQMKIWCDDPNFRVGENFFQDHFMIDCDAFAD